MGERLSCLKLEFIWEGISFVLIWSDGFDFETRLALTVLTISAKL